MREGKLLQEKIINCLKDNISNVIFYNRDEFKKHILEILPELQTNKTLLKGIILALSEDDDRGDKYYDRKGKVESDPDLKDSEIIPYKVNNQTYYETEVKPFIDDAWLETDENLINVGCEINFNKYFYVYREPEKCSSVLERLKKLKKIEDDLEDELYGGN